MGLRAKLLHISLAEELVARLGSAAEEEYMTRTEFIRQAVVDKLRDRERDHGPSTDVDARHLNILMTDRQLKEVAEITKREIIRRQTRKERAELYRHLPS
jgi:metal-responsive CopG/Arc/MetJ family transcriptional regulator